MTYATYYPQIWVKLDVRVENFKRTRVRIPDAPLVGDPVSKGGFTSLGVNIIPTNASIYMKSFREGNEAKFELPASRLPVDPRAIRQIAVTIYGGVLDVNQYADANSGVAGTNRRILLPPMDLETGFSNELFRGFADDFTITHSEDDNIISITARDITGFFLDASLPIETLSRIPGSMPLDEVIRVLIEGEPTALIPGADTNRPITKDPLLTSRAKQRQVTRRLAAYQARLAKATASLATNINDAAAITAEIGRLTTRIATLTTELGTATADETATTAVYTPSQLAAILGLPGSRGLKVINETGTPLPPIGKIKGASWFDSAGNLKKSRSRGGGGRISYWDFITDLCVGSGYICYFRTPLTTLVPQAGVLVDMTPPAELVISLPRTYYKEENGERRTFAYGFNVDSMELTRNYNGRQLPTSIAVSAIEDASGRIIHGQFPPEDDDKDKTNRSSTATEGTGDRVEIERYVLKDRVPSGEDGKEMLDRYASTIYEQLSRGEMEVKIETDCLVGLLSNWATQKADMFWLRPADPIEIYLAPESPDNTTAVTHVGRFMALDDFTKVTRLENLGVDPLLAIQIVNAEANTLLQTVFRTQSVTIDWDTNSGVKFSINAINYLDVSAFGSNI